MFDQAILTVSLIAQIVAAILAIKLISGNRRNFSLILIISIIILMLFKRFIGWLYLVEENPPESADLAYRIIDMVISLTLLLGVFIIRSKINNIQSMADRLRESEERYALAAKGVRDGLWDWNLTADKLYLSRRWKLMLGYADHELANEPAAWFELVHPDDLTNLKNAIFDSSRADNPHFEQEYRMRTHDGDYRWMLCRGVAVFDKQGNITRLAGSQTDITGRKLVEQRLKHNAYHDQLTGLANRFHFISRLGRLMEKYERGDVSHFAVLFIDLDGFKTVNDNWGHEIGDHFLISCGQRLETCVRPGDMLARIGGDEFTVLLEDITGPADAINIAERILEEMKVPQNYLNEELRVTVSIGIALNSPACTRPEDLIHNADTAMYAAKQAGKNRYEIFDKNIEHKRLILSKTQISMLDNLESSPRLAI